MPAGAPRRSSAPARSTRPRAATLLARSVPVKLSRRARSRRRPRPRLPTPHLRAATTARRATGRGRTSWGGHSTWTSWRVRGAAAAWCSSPPSRSPWSCARFSGTSACRPRSPAAPLASSSRPRRSVRHHRPTRAVEPGAHPGACWVVGGTLASSLHHAQSLPPALAVGIAGEILTQARFSLTAPLCAPYGAIERAGLKKVGVRSEIGALCCLRSAGVDAKSRHEEANALNDVRSGPRVATAVRSRCTERPGSPSGWRARGAGSSR